MRTSALLPLLAFSFALGCGSAPPPPAAPPAPAAPDPHGFEQNEVLVGRVALGDDWGQQEEVTLAKVQKAGDAGGETTFFVVRGSGGTLKSKFFWASHAASKDEIKPGVTVACFIDANKDGAFHEPPTTQAARNGRWMAGHVTDTADLEKGVIRFGTQKCALPALRVLTAPASTPAPAPAP